MARRFIGWYVSGAGTEIPFDSGHSKSNDPIRVRPIRYSDCYQIIDGHHRLAIAHARGKTAARVRVHSPAVLTPLQSLLLDVLWQNGRRELYQPIDSPELKKGWSLVRRCSDRFAKMRGFLETQGLLPPTLRTYLDIGSSYGWFVSAMKELGFDAHGVERDPFAIAVGSIVYGIETGRCVRSDCVRFLEEGHPRYDVTSCFSVLHHFALGRGAIGPEEFIRLIDRATDKVLFFDTGQNNEAWFRRSLPEWNPDYIESWLAANTTFTRFHRLGIDEDAAPPFHENYKRMLFACTR